jgi:hypothetical protein
MRHRGRRTPPRARAWRRAQTHPCTQPSLAQHLRQQPSTHPAPARGDGPRAPAVDVGAGALTGEVREGVGATLASARPHPTGEGGRRPPATAGGVAPPAEAAARGRARRHGGGPRPPRARGQPWRRRRGQGATGADLLARATRGGESRGDVERTARGARIRRGSGRDGQSREILLRRQRRPAGRPSRTPGQQQLPICELD